MRALALVLGLLAASPAAAAPEGQVGFTVEAWGGLDLYRDSSRISDFDARVASNVVTDRGRLERRGGSLRIEDLSAIGSVKHLMKWRTSDGVDRAIAHVGDFIYSMDFGTAETKVSTVAASATVDGVSGFSRFYFTDASQRLIEYNGTSTTTVPAAPISRYVEFEHERLWAANIPAESGSMVRTSSFGGAAYWTVPADSDEQCDAPDQFYFDQDDGQDISCMAKTPFGIFIGKPNKKTWVIKGVDNCTFRKVLISADAGCVDDRSVRMHEGKLRWADRGTWYEWKGAGPPVPFTQDVEPMVETLRQAENLSGTLTTDTQAEFESGNLTASGAGAPISSTIEAGAITPSSWTAVDTTSTNFAAGAAGTQFTASTWAVSGGEVRPAVIWRGTGFEDTAGNEWNDVGGLGASGSSGGRCGSGGGTFTDGGTYTLGLSECSTDSDWNGGVLVVAASDGSVLYRNSLSGTSNQTCTAYSFDLSTQAVPMKVRVFNYSGESSYIESPSFSTHSLVGGVFHYGAAGGVSDVGVFCISPNTGKAFFFDSFDPYFVPTSTYTSQAFDTAFSTPTWGAFVATVTTPAGTLAPTFTQVSADGSTWDTRVAATSDLKVASAQKRHLRYQIPFNVTSSSIGATVSAVALSAKTTATYRSAVNFVNSTVSGWGSFVASDEFADGGAATYYTRASNTSFGKDDASPAWFTQVNLSSVQAPAGQYSQWRVDYALSSASSTAKTTRVQYDYTGDSVGPVASLVFDRRYMLCGSFYSRDDYSCLLYQRNGKFVTVDGPGYISLLDFGDYAVAGSSTGYVWKILVDGLYNDDGAAIESTWVSKDFMFAPNGRDWAVGQKSFNELWIDASVSSGTILTAGYSLNKSTSYTTGDLDLGAWGDHVNKMVPFTTGYGLGKYVGFKFTNAQINKFFDIVGYSVYGVPQEKTLD